MPAADWPASPTNGCPSSLPVRQSFVRWRAQPIPLQQFFATRGLLAPFARQSSLDRNDRERRRIQNAKQRRLRLDRYFVSTRVGPHSHLPAPGPLKFAATPAAGALKQLTLPLQLDLVARWPPHYARSECRLSLVAPRPTGLPGLTEVASDQ